MIVNLLLTKVRAFDKNFKIEMPAFQEMYEEVQQFESLHEHISK